MSDPATDAPTPQDTEPDLEEQVEGLLSEVMETVETIKSKLEDEPEPAGEIESGSEINDAGVAAATQADAPVSAESSADAVDEPMPSDHTGPEADEVDPPEIPVPAETPAPQHLDAETPGHENTEAASAEPEIVADELAADIEAAIAANDEPGVPEPVQAAVTAPQSEPEAEPEPEQEQEQETDPEPEAFAGVPGSNEHEASAAQSEPAVPEYGDVDSLDDELAALASHALDEDLGATLESVPPPQPEQETREEGADFVEPIAEAPVPQAEAEPHQPEPAPAEKAPDLDPTPRPRRDPATLRWGWLPPKPEWEQVYGKWRPLVTAWRRAVWVIPPLCVFVGRWLLDRLRRAEPGARHAVAVVANPLSKREQRVRSAIGWLACWTAFWSVSLWVYVLFARSPATPPVMETPTTLAGEQTVASGDTQP